MYKKLKAFTNPTVIILYHNNMLSNASEIISHPILTKTNHPGTQGLHWYSILLEKVRCWKLQRDDKRYICSAYYWWWLWIPRNVIHWRYKSLKLMTDKINEHPTIMSSPGSHKSPVNGFKLYFSELNPDVNDLFQLPNSYYTLLHHQL